MEKSSRAAPSPMGNSGNCLPVPTKHRGRGLCLNRQSLNRESARVYMRLVSEISCSKTPRMRPWRASQSCNGSGMRWVQFVSPAEPGTLKRSSGAKNVGNHVHRQPGIAGKKTIEGAIGAISGVKGCGSLKSGWPQKVRPVPTCHGWRRPRLGFFRACGGIQLVPVGSLAGADGHAWHRSRG